MGSKSKEKSSGKERSKSKPTKTAPPVEKIDATLASLFETSLGAVKAPPKPIPRDDDDEDEDNEAVAPDEDLSSIDGSLPDDDDDEDEDKEIPGADEDSEDTADTKDNSRSRKRKRQREDENLEANYMSKLADDEIRQEKKSKSSSDATTNEEVAGSDNEDESDDDDATEKPETASKPAILHETVAGTAETELQKSQRTVFLGNVPTGVITSKTDFKTFKTFFKAAGKVESLRFRSVAFSEQIPRKAAFVQHKLHEKASSVNAYMVFADAAAARKALKFNGEVVLGNHIRVDSVAHPAPHEPKKCVFVGNLDFEAQEESLWKHFLSCGKVESVRIVRDPKTNMGKGFAYVQFEDLMSVDQALLLDGKKMEGDRRALRVTRAKTIKRKDQKSGTSVFKKPQPKKQGFVPRADPKQQATLGRATKLLGKAGAAQLKKQTKIIEGLRANETTDAGVKKGPKKNKGAKKRIRTTERSMAWKQKQASK
ncbi:RNA-binding domain-containing protein [Ascodesmis nigricans]|uniref:Nucleolar protein 12 n=1 Tax=Ascodesmis nigricans TaxID=341454 RepID=A0A4S2MWE4_9PEZI|nr:RNA-binding domain-containing protein [Ascodesmis nigricans]